MKDAALMELPKEKRHIRYDFTAVEIHDLSLQMANKTKEQAAITEEKKSVTSQYSARLNEIKATLNKLSNQVADGYETRETELVVHYHRPSQGEKTLIPVDGGKVIIEKMLQYDHNLFNQYDEKVTHAQVAEPEPVKPLFKADEGLTEPIKKVRNGLRGKK
jgi:hypothetical protein